jgi:hypothetical protein
MQAYWVAPTAQFYWGGGFLQTGNAYGALKKVLIVMLLLPNYLVKKN